MNVTTQNVQHPELIPEGVYIGGMADLQVLCAVGAKGDEAWIAFVDVVRDAAGVSEDNA